MDTNDIQNKLKIQNHILNTWPNECLPWMTEQPNFEGNSVLPEFPWGQSYTMTTSCHSLFLPSHVLLTFKNDYHDVIEIHGPYISYDFSREFWLWNKEIGAAKSFPSPYSGKRLQFPNKYKIQVSFSRKISWWNYLILHSDNNTQTIDFINWRLSVPLYTIYRDQCPLTHDVQTKELCSCFEHFRNIHEGSTSWTNVCTMQHYIPDIVRIHSSETTIETRKDCEQLWQVILQEDNIIPIDYIQYVECDTPFELVILEPHKVIESRNINTEKQTVSKSFVSTPLFLSFMMTFIIIMVCIIIYITRNIQNIQDNTKNTATTMSTKDK